jgi:hypothetical protein
MRGKGDINFVRRENVYFDSIRGFGKHFYTV